MSAGRLVTHSEFNNSKTKPVHFLQVWILPDVTGIAPEYEQKHFDDAQKRGRLRLVASASGDDGSLRIHQDARVYAALLDADERDTLPLARGRLGYVHVARGSVSLNGESLAAGDAAKIADTSLLEFSDGAGAEVLVFDLPGDR
jgi:redox-sensitive bicupin YhaK (pirin superfamily)